MNRLYDKGRNAFARGEIQWKVGGSTIRIMLVDSALYIVDYANDEFLSSIPVGARVGDNGNTGYNQGALVTLLNPTAGICDAADTTILAVPPGGPYEYIVIYKQGTSDADSQLIALLDTATNLPVTTAGSDVLASWDNGINKIFKL
jgi:hypothetical protein